MPYATQLGVLQINCIEMFIKVAFVILLSVEIEACKPRNSSPRFHRVLQQTWPRVNLNTYTFIDTSNAFMNFFQQIS